jgi:hypothetical protein
LIKHVLQISQIHRKLTSLRFSVFGVLILLNGLIYTYLLHRVGTIFSSFYHMMSNYSDFSSNNFHMFMWSIEVFLVGWSWAPCRQGYPLQPERSRIKA